jgi:hypothetical protein
MNRAFGLPAAITAGIAAAFVASVLFRADAQTAAQAWEPSRTSDGQPDIQGHWRYRSENTDAYAFYTLEGLLTEGSRVQSFMNRGVDRTTPFASVVVDPPDGKIPYQPWALERRNQAIVGSHNPKVPEHVDPRAYCFLAGVPRQTYEAMGAGPHQIVQSGGYIVMLWQWAHSYRVIPLDGRPHVPANIKLWQGDSRGRWEGRTLTVDTTNQNENWLDFIGDFHSDALHVTERFTIVDADTIRYEATLDDPKVYTRPWTMRLILVREKEAGFELFEEACYEENNVDLPRWPGDPRGRGDRVP